MRLSFAANHGDIGGGEVMLLQLARAARDLGHEVMVVAPEQPDTVLSAAEREGFTVEGLAGGSTRAYLRDLRRWAGQARRGVLWCNGLRPAVATARMRDRVVHLHQLPTGSQQVAARVARIGAMRTLVPSHFMQRRLPGSEVLWNWTEQAQARHPRDTDEFVVGFLGRLSVDKGVQVLCEAFTQVAQTHPGRSRLLLAGESRFVSSHQEAEVAAAIKATGGSVTRTEWLDRECFFDEVDLAVFPSVWDEPFGLVAAEAMAARCPFVVSDAGGLPEVVGDAYPWIVPAGDCIALAESIARAARVDWSEQLDTSHARWAAHFSPAAGQDRLGRLLHDLETAA